MDRRTLLAAAIGAVAVTRTAHAQQLVKDRRPDPSKAPGTGGRVDVHAHFSRPGHPTKLPPGNFLAHPAPMWSPEYALGFMDTHGIQTQMLSGASPSDPADLRATNEYGRSLVEAHPTRFGLLASLPMRDVGLALKEIAYAFDVLAADGIVMLTNYDGVYLGDPRLDPVFDELNRRRATVFIHPSNPACFECIALGRPAPIIEFTFDTCRAVVNLLYAGVLERCSDIKFILAHGGGPLPTLAPRISTIGTLPWVPHRPELTQHTVRELLARLYFDTAIAGTAASIAPILELTDLSHIVLGTDFPAASVPVIVQNMAASDALTMLSPAQRSTIGTNARALFARYR